MIQYNQKQERSTKHRKEVQKMFKVIAYAETIEGDELRIPLKDCETERQAKNFCQSDDLCNNDKVIKLCSYYPELAPWDFLHMILNVG